jgi:nucleosome assembly protein 1-like 1
VLAFLTDITCAPLGGEDEHGFTLSFHFAANPHFSNAVLTKRYKWADEDEDMLEEATGTVISWSAGKDTTVKVMKKKPKKGGKPLTKLEPCESFFRFFTPPEVPGEEDELSEEEAEALQDAMEADFEIGAVLRDEIIPSAVSWFTGAAVEGGDDEEEEGDEDEEDDDEDEEDEEDDDGEEGPAKAKPKGKGGKGGGKGGAAGEQPECKQVRIPPCRARRHTPRPGRATPPSPPFPSAPVLTACPCPALSQCQQQ